MQNKDSLYSYTHEKKETMEAFERKFYGRLDACIGPFKHQDQGAHVDMKRTPYRNIILHTVHDIDKICTENKEYKLRFVVTGDYKMTLAECGTPGYTLPDHLEMTEDKDCLAAGYLHIDWPSRRIKGIQSGCLEYKTDFDSLIWPLLILFKYAEEKFDPRVCVSHTVYDEERYADYSSFSIPSRDLKLCLMKVLNSFETSETSVIKAAYDVNLYARPSAITRLRELRLGQVPPCPIAIESLDSDSECDSGQTTLERSSSEGSLDLTSSTSSLVRRNSIFASVTSDEFSAACAEAKAAVRKRRSDLAAEGERAPTIPRI